jgi:arylsulfatase
MDWLGRRTNPAVTLAASVFDVILDSPIEPCLSEHDLVQRSTRWQLPDSATTASQPNIIFVAIESLRYDAVDKIHQREAVMPQLRQISRDSLRFTRAYTQSTHSDYADVAVLSSLYPLRMRTHHYYRKDDPWPKTMIYDLLQAGGYRTAIISAQNEAWGGMSNFLKTPGLTYFYDARSSDQETHVPELDPGFANEVKTGALSVGKLDDRHVIDRAIAWMNEDNDGPFFLSINLQSSHFPYVLPDTAPKPFVPCEINFDASFMYYPADKTEIVRNAYFNSLHYIDMQISRLMQAVKSLDGSRDSILVVYGENGEAFHEHGLVTHGKCPHEPTVHVPCFVYAPKHLQAGDCDYPMELIDVVPTVLGLMEWPSHPNFQGIDVLSANRPAIEERMLFIHTEIGARIDAVLLAGRWKLHHDRDTDEYLLFDLGNDPREHHNLLAENQETAELLKDVLSRWRNGQLAYYHFPHYFLRYFPPRSPVAVDRSRLDRNVVQSRPVTTLDATLAR